MRRWRRALRVIARLSPFILGFLLDRRRWLLFGRGRSRSPAAHERRARRLTAAIAALGPTYIKLAQVFSARADILPEPYLSEIGTLQDRVPPDAPERIERVLAAELGAPPDVAFERFEREPVAAASLGQVHRALVDGRDVAVKVLRPDVEELVAVDLDIAFRVLFFLNVLFPNHHVRALTAVVREFSVRIAEEMDFRFEARQIERFQRNFASDRRVRAPRVLPRYTRRRVLVMEWVEGDKIDRLSDRFASGELDFRTLMETLTEIYLRMMLVDGFLHADPHPGNILVEPDGTLCFIDWGMVVQLSRTSRERVLRIALAAGRDDVEAMVNGMYELGMIDPDISRLEVYEAAREIIAAIERVRELGARRVQELVQDILDTFYTWPLMLPQELVYFFRASALLEGIGFRYDPAFDGLSVARAVVRRMRGTLVREVREPGLLLRRMFGDTGATVAAVPDLLKRIEREEFRVRIHPQDLQHVERFLQLQIRRVLLSIFALGAALIASITFIALRNVWLLGTGLGVALVMFVVVFLLPAHLLENPLRHARGIRPRGWGRERDRGR
ncbi:MAG: ABC1 kinase family protein [Longimicrobiales bacterium]